MRNKYGAIKTEVDGFIFDSRAEARRYGELKLLEKIGEVFDLVLQPKFQIDINGKHICNYFADFQYENRTGDRVIEDVKGKRTEVYRLKKKLAEAISDIEIKEIE